MATAVCLLLNLALRKATNAAIIIIIIIIINILKDFIESIKHKWTWLNIKSCSPESASA